MNMLMGLIAFLAIGVLLVVFTLLFLSAGAMLDGFRFDGIQDHEIPPDSDWQWLTPEERLGVQTPEDAEIARQIIARRKA